MDVMYNCGAIEIAWIQQLALFNKYNIFPWLMCSKSNKVVKSTLEHVENCFLKYILITLASK